MMRGLVRICSFVILILGSANGISASEDHPKLKFKPRVKTINEDISYWKDVGRREIEKTLEDLSNINTNKAKNVIIFVGDGMSMDTLTAGRIYKAQYEARQHGYQVNGEESLLTFEKFPHVGLSKTYCVNAQTPDSAATATAIFSGVKTTLGTLGFDGNVIENDVTTEEIAAKVETVMKWAQDANKDTGFVTTARVSHATPGALYAHTANRDWECDHEMGEAAESSKDITWQLVNNDPGRKAKVVMGGGRSSFLPMNPTEETGQWDYSQDDWGCRRSDGQHLIKQFLDKHNQVPGFENSTGRFVQNRGELLSLDLNKVDYLLGLFSWDHMKYENKREDDGDSDFEEPSLSEMTKVAIEMLKKNENGFFLMVEGAKIDKAHHEGKATKALHDVVAFDRAVQAALQMVNLDETLVIVTADHGHTMTMAGYQSRGSDIRGFVDNELALDGKPFSILSYANGPGYKHHFSAKNDEVIRLDLTDENFTDFGFEQPSNAPLEKESHSGSDVGIFATGPFAHFFHTVHEQVYIANVMAYSACIGPYKDECHSK